MTVVTDLQHAARKDAVILAKTHPRVFVAIHCHHVCRTADVVDLREVELVIAGAGCKSGRL